MTNVLRMLFPRTGRHLRNATPEEIAAYLAQPCRHPSLRKIFRVGEVSIEECLPSLPNNQPWSR